MRLCRFPGLRVLIVSIALCFSREVLAQFNQQGAKLVGTGAVGSAYQGDSVSISADGNTVIVGGQNDNGGVGSFFRSNSNDDIYTLHQERGRRHGDRIRPHCGPYRGGHYRRGHRGRHQPFDDLHDDFEQSLIRSTVRWRSRLSNREPTPFALDGTASSAVEQTSRHRGARVMFCPTFVTTERARRV